jgi:hypothetical protein
MGNQNISLLIKKLFLKIIIILLNTYKKNEHGFRSLN